MSTTTAAPPATDEALRDRLKSALWFTVGKIVDEECVALGVNATPQFIAALTELVWAQTENVARDLETFARHARRATVGADDVLLLARRNEGLAELLREFVDGEEAARAKGGAAKGKGKERARR